MKKNISRIFALLIVLVIISSLTTAAFAAPEVVEETNVVLCEEDTRSDASTKGVPFGTSILTGIHGQQVIVSLFRAPAQRQSFGFTLTMQTEQVHRVSSALG